VRRFHYAWVVAAVTWITLLAAAGFRSTPSTLIVPLQNEFGWSRATIRCHWWLRLSISHGELAGVASCLR
jgi:hypothetical protein